MQYILVLQLFYVIDFFIKILNLICDEVHLLKNVLLLLIQDIYCLNNQLYYMFFQVIYHLIFT